MSQPHQGTKHDKLKLCRKDIPSQAVEQRILVPRTDSLPELHLMTKVNKKEKVFQHFSCPETQTVICRGLQRLKEERNVRLVLFFTSSPLSQSLSQTGSQSGFRCGKQHILEIQNSERSSSYTWQGSLTPAQMCQKSNRIQDVNVDWLTQTISSILEHFLRVYDMMRQQKALATGS